MTFGFEREAFLFSKRQEQYILIPKTLREHSDACGYLLEARGDPQSTPTKAFGALLAAGIALERAVASVSDELVLDHVTPKKLPASLLREAARLYGKSIPAARTMSGRWNRHGMSHAGLHIHFGSMYTYYQSDGKTHEYRGMIDIPRIVMALDKHFGKEIAETKRAPGQYEIKAHGFEYRSLPSNVNIQAVIDFLEDNWQDWVV